jgi:hypothetical protein
VAEVPPAPNVQPVFVHVAAVAEKRVAEVVAEPSHREHVAEAVWT